MKLKVHVSLEKHRKLMIGATLICAVGLVAYLSIPGKPGRGPVPDFSQLGTQDRKDAFFGYLLPIVEYHNAEIRRSRDWVLKMVDVDDMNWFDARRRHRQADLVSRPTRS